MSYGTIVEKGRALFIEIVDIVLMSSIRGPGRI